jgi:hypothetical protein
MNPIIKDISFYLLATVVIGVAGFFIIYSLVKGKPSQEDLTEKISKSLRYAISYGLLFFGIGGLSVYVYNLMSKGGVEEYSPVQNELFAKIKALKDDNDNLKGEQTDYKDLIFLLDTTAKILQKDSTKIEIKRPNSIKEAISSLDEVSNVYVQPLEKSLSSVGLLNKAPMGEGDQKLKMQDKVINEVSRAYLDIYYEVADLNYYRNENYANDSLRYLKLIQNYVDVKSYRSYKARIAMQLKIRSNELKNRLANAGGIIKQNDEYRESLNEEIKKMKQRYIDKMLITYALPIFGVIVIFLMLIPAVYKLIKIDTGTGDEAQTNNLMSMIFEKGILLQIFTVFILTVSILILGIGGKISSEVLGTLLGGISVYVLQNTFKNNGQEGK